jgi:hypothetical protein
MANPLGSMLTPMLALVAWTFAMQFWSMGSSRASLKKFRIDATPFYALAVYSHLGGVSDAVNLGLAWAFVGLQVVNGVVLATSANVPVRHYLARGGLMLLTLIAARNVVALFPG